MDNCGQCYKAKVGDYTNMMNLMITLAFPMGLPYDMDVREKGVMMMTVKISKGEATRVAGSNYNDASASVLFLAPWHMSQDSPIPSERAIYADLFVKMKASRYDAMSKSWIPRSVVRRATKGYGAYEYFDFNHEEMSSVEFAYLRRALTYAGVLV